MSECKTCLGTGKYLQPASWQELRCFTCFPPDDWQPFEDKRSEEKDTRMYREHLDMDAQDEISAYKEYTWK